MNQLSSQNCLTRPRSLYTQCYQGWMFFFSLDLGFLGAEWVSGHFLTKSGKICFCGRDWRFFTALYYRFTDDTNINGIKKPVAINPIIFILPLFHINSAFSIVDTDIQLVRASQLMQHHCPILLLTYHCWYDDVIYLTRGHIRTSFRTKDIERSRSRSRWLHWNWLEHFTVIIALVYTLNIIIEVSRPNQH